MKYIPIFMIIIIVCCFKTIYKTILKTKRKFDIAWVRKYVIKREMIRTVLSVVLVILGYLECIYEKQFSDETMFSIISALAVFIFIRSVGRIIIVLSRSEWFKIEVAECLNVKLEETGSDVDSASVESKIKTNMGDFSFSGFGPSMFLSSNMKKGDTILIIRFKFRKSPYMFIGISKTVETDFAQ